MAEGGGGSEQDKDAKTEEPTERRLEEARKKGQVINSKEVGTALLFLAALVFFFFQGQTLWLDLQNKMRFLLGSNISDDFNPASTAFFLQELIPSVLMDLLPFFLLFMVVAILGPLLQHGWLFSFEPLQPKFSKINPLQGFKRMFSIRSLVELVKSLLKMSVVGIAVYLGVKDSIDRMILLPETSVPVVVAVLADDALNILWRVALAFILIAILDFLYQRHDYLKNLRMTKQEIRDEQKQQEGDPHIKGKIKEVQREMARRRMMEEVPKADVVITNPTHYSVAIQYTPNKMEAPTLIAKGRGPIALNIREAAKKHDIPLVENPPLARTLYRDVALETMVPASLFKAVAEVLAYVYRLKGKHS